MRLLLIIATLTATNLVLAVQCQDIHITDNCHAVGNFVSKLFSYQTQVSFICETQTHQKISRTIDFESLRAELDCARFQESISQGDMSLQSIEATAYNLNHPPQIKVIGDNLVNTRQQRIDAQARSYKSDTSSSLSEAMKYRRQ